jgi:hypothetical protein
MYHGGRWETFGLFQQAQREPRQHSLEKAWTVVLRFWRIVLLRITLLGNRIVKRQLGIHKRPGGPHRHQSFRKENSIRIILVGWTGPSPIACLWWNLFIWVIWNVMGALLALDTIFEVQRKRSNNKKTNKLSNLHNMVFFFFFGSLWTPPTFKAHYFFNVLFILNDLKCYRSATWSFTNHLGTAIAIE